MSTSIIFTNGAMSDRSMIITYSCNDKFSDHRLAYISKNDYLPNEKRPILKKNNHYNKVLNNNKTNTIGYIPQVKHTYAYFSGNNITMNEHNLTIITYSNKTKSYISSTHKEEHIHNNKDVRLFCGQELSYVAAERCKSSKDAVKVIEDLIDTYGIYSSCETLLIADENEAWVIDIYNSTWSSKRVPDGEIFIYSDETIDLDKSISNDYKIEVNTDYSFSIKYKNKINLSDVFSLYRDYDIKKLLDINKSVINSYYTYICQIRPSKPDLTKGLIWVTPGNPSTSCFVPIFSKSNSIPLSYTTRASKEYNSNCAFWTFKFVDNLIKSGFDKYIKNDIGDLQRKLEIMSYDFIIDCDKKCIGISNFNTTDYITNACEQNVNVVLKSWLKLAFMLINKHKNNYSKI